MGKSSLVIYNGVDYPVKFSLSENAYWGVTDFAKISCELTNCPDESKLAEELKDMKDWEFTLTPGQRTPSHATGSAIHTCLTFKFYIK